VRIALVGKTAKRTAALWLNRTRYRKSYGRSAGEGRKRPGDRIGGNSSPSPRDERPLPLPGGRRRKKRLADEPEPENADQDGRTAFNLIQNALEHGDAALIFFVFDLLFLDGEDLTGLPLVDRKTRLEAFLVGAPDNIRYVDHQIGHGPDFHRIACEHGLEGIVSKRVEGRYEPDRRTWLKTKCLNREEFVVAGWSDPEGTRHRIGALLLGYYTPDGDLIYAGRVGTGMPVAELERLYGRLQALTIPKMPLSEPPPRGGRFGSPLVLSRVHWVRPEMVVEVSYVEMTPDGLLRHVVYLGEREDKLAIDVRRDLPT
jgi:bifunctional non-homologous end joining protein LigD